MRVFSILPEPPLPEPPLPESWGMCTINRVIAFRLNLALWALIVPVLALRYPLAELLRRTQPSSRTPFRGLAARFIVRRVKRACRRPVVMRDRPCLREGLLAYRFLRRAGYCPVLHFGIDRASVARPGMVAHCWVTLEGEVLLNPPPPDHIEIHTVGSA
jgi:Transglutaminase-like superfamily